ncbi:MAG: hypothetical protein ACOCWO_01385, partial [Candidatus Muiribacteriaceae bacterium]
LGFAPLLSYEKFVTRSMLWLFEEFNTSFIKRIPINNDVLKTTDYDLNTLSFRIFANFQNYFHSEILHFVHSLQQKYNEVVRVEVFDIDTKEASIEYGTDFCVLMDNKIINPVNLMKFDFDEFINKLLSDGKK